ncbi:hypothetical protein [Bacillus sp. FJAT-27245]|uniref:hypothetical protein n=1 Tax=Bacillus sp. FJAT-27245 TaxID=1684144 RepID=UPI0006A7E1F2|nr:hypothetical protein [Bacillus sp. FJAT-27245]
MNSQDEFRELELQLNSLPSKKMNPNSFNEIHQRLVNKAAALDRRERWSSVLKKTAMGMAGAAVLCLMLFFGFSMGPQFNSGDSSKMSGSKSDADSAQDRAAYEREFKPSGKLVVETRDGAKEEITEQAKIDKVAEILEAADWEDAKMQMATQPDYKLNNHYFVWRGPGSGSLEIIIDGGNKYTKLSEEASAAMYEIITGEKLGE